MLTTLLMILLLTLAALAVAIVDQALGPDNHNFPCASPTMHWLLRLYALALFNRAASLTGGAWHGAPQAIGWDMLAVAALMTLVHGMVLFMLLRNRLPAGVWPRLQMRMEISKRSFN